MFNNIFTLVFIIYSKIKYITACALMELKNIYSPNSLMSFERLYTLSTLPGSHILLQKAIPE